MKPWFLAVLLEFCTASTPKAMFSRALIANRMGSWPGSPRAWESSGATGNKYWINMNGVHGARWPEERLWELGTKIEAFSIFEASGARIGIGGIGGMMLSWETTAMFRRRKDIFNSFTWPRYAKMQPTTLPHINCGQVWTTGEALNFVANFDRWYVMHWFVSQWTVRGMLSDLLVTSTSWYVSILLKLLNDCHLPNWPRCVDSIDSHSTSLCHDTGYHKQSLGEWILPPDMLSQ